MDETLRYISEPPQAPLLLPPKWWHRFPKLIPVAIGLVPAALLFFLYFSFISAPSDFSGSGVYQVAQGETLSSIASHLGSAHIVRSEFAFKAFVKVFAPRSGALAGDYEFDKPENAIWVAWRVANGLYDLTPERVTIPEGLSSADIAALFAKDPRFTAFDPEDFKKQAVRYEGYLFPDTYLFLPNITAQQAITAMVSTYSKRIAALSSDMAAFGKPSKDIIIMASIIEREARTEETRRIIAGILWKRLAEGMPLQVDATFAFVNGKKDSRQLTLEDLQIDSPYNTYAHKGLPPGPISNPGLDAIRDTVHPTATPYYFYLSDSQGNMHYAVTHAEHVANKAKYIQ